MSSFIRKHFDLTMARWKSGDGKAIVHDGVISTATGVAVGYAAAHSKNDLELTIARRRVPLDFTASLAGLAFSLGFGNKGTRDVVRQASVAGLAISSYRATERYIHLHGAPRPMLVSHAGRPPAAHAGEIDMSNDPVLAAAANL